MRAVSLQRKLYGYIALTLLVLAAIAVAILLPSLREIAKLSDELADTQQLIEDRYRQAQNMQRSLQELDDISEQVSQFSTQTLTVGDELSLITELESLAAAYNIDQQLDIQVTDINKGELKERIDLTFANRGSYADHIAYLQALEQQEYVMHIRRLIWESRPVQGVTTTPILLRFNGFIYATP